MVGYFIIMIYICVGTLALSTLTNCVEMYQLKTFKRLFENTKTSGGLLLKSLVVWPILVFEFVITLNRKDE